MARVDSNVYVFGSGDCGQLGLGEDVDLKSKPTLHPYFAGKNIWCVAAGGLHSLALSHSGQVYSWGCNDEKALGHGPGIAEFEVGPVSGLEEIKITQIAAGDSISAALSTDGKVYAWGTFRDSRGVLGYDAKGTMIQEKPTLIDGLAKERIVQIAAGANHLMAINEKGELFSWGCGEQGQLGRRILERHRRTGLRPTNITPRDGRSRAFITKVICGSYHTLAIRKDGNVYAMGLNNFGQLGLGDHEERQTAELIDGKEIWGGEAKVVDAGAGEHHSMVLLDNGQVYAFGRADSGQLGVETGGERAFNEPVKVPFQHKINLISAGGNHNLAFSERDELFSWGFGEMHQLGHGPAQDEARPRAIQTKLQGVIQQLSAGGQHSIILATELPL